jgi:hypothetical protein
LSILRYTMQFKGQTFGTGSHPFGAAVTDSEDDLRLACVAMNMLDYETFVVANFHLTNKGIWAFYERLPFGQNSTGPLGFYRAFSSTKRVASRTAEQVHELVIEYDKDAGEIRWYVGTELVMTADNIGVPIADDPSVKLILDHGGTDTTVSPNGLNAGFGIFTLLDMSDPLEAGMSNTGLVRLNSIEGAPYQNPSVFVDEDSDEANRLFGQGAEITVYNTKVEYVAP